MKSLRVLLSFIVVATILLATSLSGFAIGFVAEEIYESVFVVYSGNSLGSGFAIGKDCIVTNAHVIDNPNRVVIKAYSGEEYTAFVVGINQEQDIAVLGVEGIEFSYLTVADTSLIKTGDDIYAVGAPMSMTYTLTKGVISARNREVRGNKYIQIDAAINEGNSGGPLLNDSGQVLGINTLKRSDSEGIGLAIPMETVKNFLISLGLEFDESGNVTGDVKIPSKPNDTNDNVKPNDTVREESNNDENKNSPASILIYVIAVLSIIGNIALSIALFYQKKKNLNLKYDPRERTDFDIDILG